VSLFCLGTWLQQNCIFFLGQYTSGKIYRSIVGLKWKPLYCDNWWAFTFERPLSPSLTLGMITIWIGAWGFMSLKARTWKMNTQFASIILGYSCQILRRITKTQKLSVDPYKNIR
jgi:hypothetical protein